VNFFDSSMSKASSVFHESKQIVRHMIQMQAQLLRLVSKSNLMANEWMHSLVVDMNFECLFVLIIINN
jgi:hypothetical protein